MTPTNNKRTKKQIVIDREKIKKMILEKFKDGDEFTLGDIYYSIYPTWNKSKFGSVFHDVIALTKSDFLQYRMGYRRSMKCKNKYEKYGAIYSLV